jgi:hypothetical protein
MKRFIRKCLKSCGIFALYGLLGRMFLTNLESNIKLWYKRIVDREERRNYFEAEW